MAERICAVTYDRLDSETVASVKRLIGDGIAVAISGSVETPPRIVAEYVRDLGCRPQASVWGFALKSSPVHAAFANGVSIGVIHQYARDGDYNVQLTVTTVDGRTASAMRTVPVKTHDVAITRLTAPQAAKSGQTRRIAVELNSKRYPERVEVQLFKSVPGGFQWVTTTVQNIPVRAGGRTTSVMMSYTFVKDDARMGKVNFRAVANILDYRDALPADNEAISAPTKVSK